MLTPKRRLVKLNYVNYIMFYIKVNKKLKFLIKSNDFSI